MQKGFIEYQQLCNESDIAFYELLKSIHEINKYEASFSDLEISELKICANVLNRLIERYHAKSLHPLND